MNTRFQLVGTLGEGGTALVYEAVDARHGRRVALKFLVERTDLAAARRKLSQECDALARVADAGVCAAYGVAECDGLPCLVMERLRGRDLKWHLANRKLPITEVLRLALQIANALRSIHRAGLVHNDIKPANIVLTALGARILDFGLATTVDARVPRTPGRPWRDSVFGTADYIAPERILCRPVTPLSDLFSFGAVLYEMITGVKPFTAGSVAETVFNVLDECPMPIARLRPECPAALSRVVAKLLAKRPEDRVRSAAALCRALQHVSLIGRQSSRRLRTRPLPEVGSHEAPPQRSAVRSHLHARIGARCHA